MTNLAAPSLSARDGNTLAVGAVNEDSGAKGVNPVTKGKAAVATNSGAVYVYTRDAKGWKQQAYIKASNTAEGGAVWKRGVPEQRRQRARRGLDR